MDPTCQACAGELLEAVPMVMRFIRDQVRRRGTKGLSLLEFRTLALLNRVKDLSLSAAAEHLGILLPAMSRLVNVLVDRGWVRRQPVSSNRRQIALRLTARGQATLEMVRRALRRQLAQALQSMSPADCQTVVGAMRVLRRTFEPRLAIGAKASVERA